MYRDNEMTSSEMHALAAAGAAPEDITVRRPNLAVVEVPAGEDAHAFAKRLGAQPGVVAAARVGQVRALEAVPPNDTRYSHELTGGTFFIDQQTYLGPNSSDPYSMDIEPVWDAVFNTDRYAAEPDRAGVKIAIVDTGVSASIMEDNGRITPVWNYVAGNTNTRDDFFPLYHGTRVASLMAAQTNNSFGIAGTLHATESQILVYKVLDSSGSGTSVDS
ncbi:hypothetical protein EG835_13330, partial [bacterium]|nr:hypothetical protein [bacterium]